MSKVKVVLFALLLSGALTYTAYRFHTGRVTAAAPAVSQRPPQASKDLRRFMQANLHQEYTFLSFTVWHDRPLTPEKMDSIAASSSRVIDMARDLNGFTTAYGKQGWSKDDLKFFDQKRLQLSRVAEELNRAARKRDSQEVINFFMHLDSTCQSCHRRFRPDLQWI